MAFWRAAALTLLRAAWGCSFELADLSPLGSAVHGLDPRHLSLACALELQDVAARRGAIFFRRLQNLTAAELLQISLSFGSREVISRHVAHPESPEDGILRLSNQAARGVVGVGPQWHHDGSTERRVFSHLLFHAQQMPPTGGETDFADLATAYEALPPDLQERWSHLASVNAYSGAVHPLVHRHPISGRKVLFLHMGQTGALVSRNGTSQQLSQTVPLTSMAAGVKLPQGLRALSEEEVTEVFRQYEALLSRAEIWLRYRYEEGDLVLVDNLAVAHRAAPSSHQASAGTRVLHRTTVGGTQELTPLADGLRGIPAFLYIFGENPFCDAGLWQAADYFGVGFRWNRSMKFQN